MATLKQVYMPEESRRFFPSYTVPAPAAGIWVQPSSRPVSASAVPSPPEQQHPAVNPWAAPAAKPLMNTSSTSLADFATPTPPFYARPPGPAGPSTSPTTTNASNTSAPQQSPQPTSGASSQLEDELIPTAIVVKNIPFAIKKEQLTDFMTQLRLPLPYAFNYHFDNGVFRGLAFANFSTPEETALAITTLNGREIGGRKLRVEYKKMLPFQERERIEREKREKRGQLEEQHVSPPPSVPSSAASAPASPGSSFKIDMNDQETLSMYSTLLLFREDRSRSDLQIAAGALARPQLKVVSALCDQLELCYSVSDQGSVSISRFAPLPVKGLHPTYLMTGPLRMAVATSSAADTIPRVKTLNDLAASPWGAPGSPSLGGPVPSAAGVNTPFAARRFGSVPAPFSPKPFDDKTI